jgi:arylsulfatase A-like enzyme
MHRREFLAAAAGAALAACTEPQVAERPPNIVFIMADDLGYAHLGCYGQKEIRTPRLDAFAKEALRFTQAYSGCTVCAPARSSLMTGMHTGHTPVRGNSGGLPLPAPATTVAEILKQAGYATGIFGKWGLGEAGTEGVPENQGFDETLGPLHQIHAQYYYPEFLWKNGSPLPLPENENGRKGRYAPDAMLGGALEFLRAHADHPFFLYFPSIVPHHEFQVPEENF